MNVGFRNRILIFIDNLKLKMQNLKRNYSRFYFFSVFILFVYSNASCQKGNKINIVNSNDSISVKNNRIINDLNFKQNTTVNSEVKSIVVDTTIKLPTIINTDTIIRSEYYDLLEKVVEQKQLFYDSSLSTLNLWAAIIAVFIGFVTVIFLILAFIGFSKIKDIEVHLEEGLDDKVKKIVTSKYEADISYLNERMDEIESISESKNPTEKINGNQSDNPFNKKP